MKLLIVDDEENVRKGIVTFLGLSGHEARAVADLGAAREELGSGAYGAALVDVYIGRENGASLLDFTAERRMDIPLIMMSGKASLSDAVAAVRRGAYDFLEKPLDTDRLLATLRNLERETAAEHKIAAFRDAWLSEHVYMESGGALEAAFEAARRTAGSPLSVLVSGPTGSGKELVARWIHLCSPRSQGPFVAVNCAAIPAELAESALFGSRRGSYTGSVADRQGYFEAATGGTLFLDEVGELTPAIQAAILRAVELGEIQSVGAEAAKRIDVRIVAASNRDLRADSAAGSFREDLFWRLAQASIALPSLAERRSEIKGLATFLAAPIRAQRGRDAPLLTDDALAYLESRPWPGNVRELRAFVERALWLASARESVDSSYLAGLESSSPRAETAMAAQARGPQQDAGRRDGPSRAFHLPEGASLAQAKEAFERAYVEEALEEAGGSVARAAERLGLLPNNLSRKLKELGLR